MVFAINPPAEGDKTFEAFKAQARATLNTTSTVSSSPFSTLVSHPIHTPATTYTSYFGSVPESSTSAIPVPEFPTSAAPFTNNFASVSESPTSAITYISYLGSVREYITLNLAISWF